MLLAEHRQQPQQRLGQLDHGLRIAGEEPRRHSGTSRASAGRYGSSSGSVGVPAARNREDSASISGRNGTTSPVDVALPRSTGMPRSYAR